MISFFSRRSLGFAKRLTAPSKFWQWGWVVLAGCGSLAFGRDPADSDRVERYATVIGRAQADLDAGQVDAAVERLEATESDLRGFEYDYLLARAAGAKAGATAPDMIRSVDVPPVDTRYGVLDEVSKRIAFICRDGAVRVHDLKMPDAAPRVVPHPGGAIWSGDFSRNGELFAAGYANGSVVVWDAADWTVRHVMEIDANSPVRVLALAPNGTAVVAEAKKALELWSLSEPGPQKIAAVGERYNFGEGLAFSPQGDQFATGGMFDIVLHNAKTGEVIQSITHASYTMGLEFSPDGQRIASAPRGNVNKFLSIFELPHDKPLFTAGPFQFHIDGLAFTPDGKRLIATGPQKDLRLFDAETGIVMLTLKRPNRTAQPGVSEDGRLLGWMEPSGYHYIDLDRDPATP